MKKRKSCGILLFSHDEPLRFLLMKHDDRLDLPKGHIEKGESEIACALREFEEETGISKEKILFMKDFRFEEQYIARYEKHSYDKTLVIFAARLKEPVEISVSEHGGFTWLPFEPPHSIQKNTIDKVLTSIEKNLNQLH